MQIELRNIHKRFGKVHANNDITLAVPSGTIQGILGENGAGKSTLMKILSGFYLADEGEILLDGKPVEIHSPSNALQHGIGMLHQDPLDFPPMRALDNALIGHDSGLFPDRAKATKELLDLQKEFGFNIDLDAYVDTLTVGERQQLEIVRLLWLGARALILDEPTTGISALQKEKLFAALRKLCQQGVTILFVSHKLEEVESLCDRVAVFRHGKVVGEVMPPYNTDDFVTMMFGKPIRLGSRQSSAQEETVLALNNLTLEDYRLQIKNIHLNVRQGEVIGLAGMEGSGQRQFLQACAGRMRPTEGKLFLHNQNVTGKHYRQFMHRGVAYIPAARLEEGLVHGLTLTEHFVLSSEQSGLFIDRQKSTTLTESGIANFNIRGTPEHQIEALSGGNQQRALLALLKPVLSLILMEHPTRGLDVESAIWIWSRLKERCKGGAAIIFTSSDLEEVLYYSDRILVFFGGKVSQPLDARSTSVDQLGQLIGGKGF